MIRSVTCMTDKVNPKTAKIFTDIMRKKMQATHSQQCSVLSQGPLITIKWEIISTGFASWRPT